MNPWYWLIASGGLAIAFYLSFVAVLIIVGRKETARAVTRFVPDCIVLIRRLLADPRVPRRKKAVLVGLVAYLALPFDLVPDFIPIAGYLDDAVIVALVLCYVLRGSNRGLIERHWPGPQESLRLILRLTNYKASLQQPDLSVDSADHEATFLIGAPRFELGTSSPPD